MEIDVNLRKKSVPPVLVDTSYDYYCDPIVRKPPNFRFSTNEPGWHVCLANTDVPWPGKKAPEQQFQMSSFVKGFWRDTSATGRYMLWYSVALDFRIGGTHIEVDTNAGRAPARIRVNGAGRVAATAESLASTLEAAGFEVKTGSGLGSMSTSIAVTSVWAGMKNKSRTLSGGVNELLIRSPNGDSVYLYWLRREWTAADGTAKSAWFLNATVNLKQRPVGSVAGMFGIHEKSELDVRKAAPDGAKVKVEGPWSFQRTGGGKSYSGEGDAAITAELEFQMARGADGDDQAAQDLRTRISWGKIEDLTPFQYIRQFETTEPAAPEDGDTPDYQKVDY